MTKTITSFFTKRVRKEESSGAVKKLKTSGSALVSDERNKIKEKDGTVLTDDVIQLLKHFTAEPHDSTNELVEKNWNDLLRKHFSSSSFSLLARFVANERKQNPNRIFPPVQETFACFNHSPLHSVKVVIIGQDPYHGPGQGHGLCFSVRRGVRIPPSLRNIYKEIYTTGGRNVVNIPKHGNL